MKTWGARIWRRKLRATLGEQASRNLHIGQHRPSALHQRAKLAHVHRKRLCRSRHLCSLAPAMSQSIITRGALLWKEGTHTALASSQTGMPMVEAYQAGSWFNDDLGQIPSGGFAPTIGHGRMVVQCPFLLKPHHIIGHPALFYGDSVSMSQVVLVCLCLAWTDTQ